jgi:hypothetical protein
MHDVNHTAWVGLKHTLLIGCLQWWLEGVQWSKDEVLVVPWYSFGQSGDHESKYRVRGLCPGASGHVP